MKNLIFGIVVISAVFVLLWPYVMTGLDPPLSPPIADESSVILFLETGIEIPVEVADTPESRQQGLMGRESLEGGMIFLFEQEQPLGFWMKNTLIPLDIFYLDKDFTIVDIQTMIPCEEDPCPVYLSKEPAQSALEVNAGFAEENGIMEGQQLTLNM